MGEIFQNKTPIFDGMNYAYWSIKMETYLTAIGFDIWQSVVDGYTPPQNPPTDTVGKRKCENNTKAKHAIYAILPKHYS